MALVTWCQGSLSLVLGTPYPACFMSPNCGRVSDPAGWHGWRRAVHLNQVFWKSVTYKTGWIGTHERPDLEIRTLEHLTHFGNYVGVILSLQIFIHFTSCICIFKFMYLLFMFWKFYIYGHLEVDINPNYCSYSFDLYIIILYLFLC